MSHEREKGSPTKFPLDCKIKYTVQLRGDLLLWI